MKIARTIGTVTLSRSHPALVGARLRCVEQLERMDAINNPVYGGDTIVAWDVVASGVGDRVAMSEGPEAARIFYPTKVPIDASVVAILDHFDT